VTEFAPQLKLLHYPRELAGFLAKDYNLAPVQVEISPTNSCNAKCPWCFYVSGEYKQRHSDEALNFLTLCKCLEELADMGCRAVTWTGGGDPSTYYCIDNAISHAHHLGLKQGIFTNAYKPLREPEKLDWIRVTVTEKFLITKHVAAYAKATKTGVNFNLCLENQDKLYDLMAHARDAGVAYFQIRPALADRADLQQPVRLPYWVTEFDSPEFRVVTTDYKWQDYLQAHGYPKCHGHNFVPFLWHNGDLAVCAYHFGKPEYTFGNICLDGGFEAVWKGQRRQQMLDDGIAVIKDCQHCCKLHEINKPLAILAGDVDGPDDVAFL
jgi:cyclic pyranopterin phosphate synthase